jgi:hypothetical protein
LVFESAMTIRLRRVKGRAPLLHFYEVELEPPDAAATWRPGKPVWGFSLSRRLSAEGYYQRDVADLLLEADQLWDAGDRGRWIEHAGVRPRASEPRS